MRLYYTLIRQVCTDQITNSCSLSVAQIHGTGSSYTNFSTVALLAYEERGNALLPIGQPSVETETRAFNGAPPFSGKFSERESVAVQSAANEDCSTILYVGEESFHSKTKEMVITEERERGKGTEELEGRITKR